jgi:hypothetical protein
LSIYTGQIGQMLHVYSQHVKTQPRHAVTETKQDGRGDSLSLTLSAQQRKKLEQLAIQNIGRLTRKSGAGNTSLSFQETLDAIGKGR